MINDRKVLGRPYDKLYVESPSRDPQETLQETLQVLMNCCQITLYNLSYNPVCQQVIEFLLEKLVGDQHPLNVLKFT